MSRLKLIYIISDINKALAFEWIAENLSSNTFDLSFVLLNASGSLMEDYLLSHNIKVTRIECSGKKDWPKSWLKLFLLLRKEKPAIVHCHLLTANILGLSAAKFAGIKSRIYTRHHSDYHFRYFPKGVKYDKFCNSLATHIIAPSNTVKSVLVQLESVKESKVSVINHGFQLNYFNKVPTKTINEIKSKYNGENKHPVVGVLSRFTELKGIQYIIPAFKKLLEVYPNALLLLFNGEGDYKNEINKLLIQLPETSYKVVAFEQELAAVYTLFDIFVQASTDTFIESFGQTYVEALASKVPSVFTLAGVAPDFIVHKKNAFVVPFKDSESIKDGFLTLLEDKDLKNKIIEEGWISVKDRFSLQKMIVELTQLYSK